MEHGFPTMEFNSPNMEYLSSCESCLSRHKIWLIRDPNIQAWKLALPSMESGAACMESHFPEWILALQTQILAPHIGISITKHGI